LQDKFMVFLDRDGVINQRLFGNYVKSWEEFKFLPGVLGALKRLANAGHRVIIVSNQSGIGRELMGHDDLKKIHREMNHQIEEAGGKILRIYVCPHHPDDGCSCRKPRPGLLLQAAEEYGIDLSKSFFVGDCSTDTEAGNRVGCTTIQVGTEPIEESPDRVITPRYRAKNLSEAVEIILSDC
jgi:histidinol-phosphate phosphatase family protein